MTSVVLASAVCLAGWLAVCGWALSGPRLGSRTWLRGRGRAANQGIQPQTPPRVRVPATIVALMAGLPAADQFKVTLLELGTRGWFRLTGAKAGAARAVCVLPVEAPVEELAPYERIAVTHLARRAGTHTQVPADAIADGFDGGESGFLAVFRRSVIEQARVYGLTRPTLSVRRKAAICLLALIPAAAPLLEATNPHHTAGRVFGACIFYYVVLCLMVVRVSSERLTSYGVQTLARQRAAPDPPGRVSEAALGRDTAILAPFTAPGKNRAWSGHGENWRLVAVGNPATRVWPGMTHRAFRVLWVVALPGVSVLALVSTFSGHSFGEGVLASLALDALVLIVATAPWLRLPTHAEFEGQVLRQWNITGDDDEVAWNYCLAIDDGTSPRAWALTVTGPHPSTLAPGTTVQVTVNPRLNKVRSIHSVQPAAAAAHLLNPTPDPRTGGLG